MSGKSYAPPTWVLAEKLVRDIRLTTRKRHSVEDKIRIVLEGRGSEESIENIEKLGAESFAFPVPFPTPLPFPQTCSQPWVGLKMPVYSQEF